MYRPNKPFNTEFKILNPTVKKINGKVVKEYGQDGEKIYGAYTTFGGTDTTVNGIRIVLDTGVIETWYRPDIKSDTRLKSEDGSVFEVEGAPENIELRNQFFKIKVKRMGGIV